MLWLHGRPRPTDLALDTLDGVNHHSHRTGIERLEALLRVDVDTCRACHRDHGTRHAYTPLETQRCEDDEIDRS